MLDTSVLPDIEEEISEFDGMAHFVRIKALLQGGVVVALCGKRYIPTIVGAEVCDLPVCQKCRDLMDLLESMYGA